jgi:hypothetical protein
MRSASFREIAERLRVAHLAFASVAGTLDAITTTAPPVVPARPVEGVARPVEDLVVARESAGIYRGLDAAKCHAMQSVLRAEAALVAACAAVEAYGDDK